MPERYSQEEMQQILQAASLLQQQEFLTSSPPLKDGDSLKQVQLNKFRDG